jgi:signal transduction histidine kinase
MAVWTVVTVAGYLRRPSWLTPLVVADIVVTLGLMSTSLVILSPAQFAAGIPLITTVWSAATPVAAGVLAGRTAGAATGVLVAAGTAFARGTFDTNVAIDAVLLISSGFIVGAASHTARRSAERLARALRIEAANAERERLARSIHDGVLQVLAGVRKRGDEMDGPAGELARLAGDQEIALRSLIASTPAESGSNGEQDLGARLRMLASRAVEVSLPATTVRLPGHAVDELTAAVGEALANANEHAGQDATTWLLLEDLPDSVVITVRDDGAGIPEGRLAVAEREGRLGVAQSMRARITALGGTLHLETAPQEGTEWEITLPKPAR